MLTDSHQSGRDIRLISRATRERWKLSRRRRKAIVDRLMGVVEDYESKPDHAISAARALIQAYALNVADQKNATPRQGALSLTQINIGQGNASDMLSPEDQATVAAAARVLLPGAQGSPQQSE